MHIRTQAVTSVKWNLISQLTKLILYLLTTLIFTRLLDPKDFGLLGMATVFTSLVFVFNDFGIGAAVIQIKDTNDELLSSTFWIALLIGFSSVVLTFLLSPYVSNFYAEPQLEILLNVLSLSFLLTSFGQIQISFLIKSLTFKTVAIIEITGAVIGSSIGIVMALLGYGVWSLAAQLVITSGCVSIISWFASNWRPKFIFRKKYIKEVINFSSGLLGFNLLNYFSRNSDYLLIGKFLGSEALGLYTFAYRLMQFPLQYISSVVSRVLFPTLSLMQDDNSEIRKTYIQTSKSVALITFPIMTLVSILAPEIVPVIFGDKWNAAIPVLQIFGFVGAIQSIITLNGNIYTAKGRTDLLFYWGIVSSSIAVAGFVIGLRWGITGVALGYAFATLLVLIPNFAIPFRLINQNLFQFLYALRVQILMTFATGILVYGAANFLRRSSISDVVILLSCSLLGMIVYVLGTFTFDRKLVISLFETLNLRSLMNPIWPKQSIPNENNPQ